MPQISVITPVYNRPQFLEEAVESIQQQTFNEWEHIIVDDGSTNPLTQEILKKISGLPKTFIYRRENGGLGAARNFGIERSNGQYILTLDDDDKWHPDFMAEAVKVINEKPGTGVVTSWLKEFGISHRLVKVTGGDVKSFLIENNSVHGLFKKELWTACGKYDERLPAYEDWDFWLRLTALGYRVEVIPAAYFYYRDHNYPSLLKDAKDKHMELFRYIVEKNKSIYQEHMVDALCLLEEKLLQTQNGTEAKTIKKTIKKLIGLE